jgi:hypothetical protein
MYYLAVTEKNLHVLGFNGEAAFLHDSYPFSKIEQSKLNAANTLSGETMQFTFNYEDMKLTFDLSGALLAYPKFDVIENTTKVMLRTQNDRYFNPFERKFYANETELGDNAYYIDLIVRQKINKNFMLKLEKELSIAFPDVFKM